MDANPLRIDVVSDVVCPWCFVGKRQLEQALARWRRDHPDRPVEVHWHPFQLNPDLPADGMARTDYLAGKFGSADTSRIYANVNRAASAVDLPLAIESIARQPNTLRAHALIDAAAKQEGLQDALVEALFVAYFQQARDLTDVSELRRIAHEAGLSESAVDQALGDAQAHLAIAEADQRARRAGIRGVPCFIVNGRSAVSGAQGADAIIDTMLLEAEAS
ncbi:MAG: DsbA family oxidoreductase [Betaproteobacteria bacterium]|nr:DsbA family oxidoreductase [Betaproteobacteria bacterium]